MVDVNSVTQRNFNKFDTLCNKIACLVYSRTDGDKQLLNQILDELNELDYNLFLVNKQRGNLIINQCCYVIPAEEESLVSKAISLFTSLITKAQVIVEGKTLTLAVNWCLESLKYGNQVIILKCLQALSKGNGKKIEEDCPQVFFTLQRISNNFTFISGSEEICLNCFRCVESMTCCYDEDKLSRDSFSKFFKVFTDVLLKEKNISGGNEVLYCKFLIIAMRGIENLIQSYDLETSELEIILGIAKGYMLYGIDGFNEYKIEKIFPSTTTIPEVLKCATPPILKLRGKYDRRSKKVAVSSIDAVEEVDDITVNNDYVGFQKQLNPVNDPQTPYKTSDSEYSDSEFSQSTKIKSYEGKVRHCVLILLGKIVRKTDPELFAAYMLSFLPDGSQFLQTRTLTTCLLKDPSPKCRCEALGVLITIISNSRKYFLLADGVSKSSFTSFSCTISNIIKELQRCLLKILSTEKNNVAIQRTLKCISDLIRCSPFHKLEPGLITNIAHHVKPFLKHKDVNAQIFALTVFGCIVSVEPKVQEIRTLITGSCENSSDTQKTEEVENDDDDFHLCDSFDYEILQEKPWLFKQCLLNLTSKDKDVATNSVLQVESLQVIGALVRNFFRETLVSFPNDIIDLLKNCSNKSDYLIKLYAGKLMETVFNSLQFSFFYEDELKRAPITLVTNIWVTLLPGPVTSLIQSQDEPMLRCTGCDCIANVGIQIQKGQTSSVQSSLIFDQLPRDKQIMCITHLFGCIRDESPAVRNSAIRAMTIFVMFQSLREDSLFFLDVVDTIISCAKDKNNLVRTPTSWLLANLSEALVLNKQHRIDDGVTLDTLAKLIDTGIKLAGDIQKIKTGAVRGLGNLLQVVDEDFLKNYKKSVVDGIESLIKNATTGTFMKARWNSCYAIANALQNSLIHSNYEWTSRILKVMVSLVQNYKNFKVRISAGFVLGIPPKRENFGDYYNEVWTAVLNALENSKNISDFNEYQHRDQLVDQLCLVLCHLINVIKPSDLNPLQDILYFHLDNLRHFMTKFQERIVPEKSSVLLNAREKIHFLLDEKNLTVEDKNVIRVLEGCLDSEF